MSSPSLPRPTKRANTQTGLHSYDRDVQKYPTPMPTSSTGILSSSPPVHQRTRRPLQRTMSTLSERAPLAAVPTIELDEGGEPTLMGRSSNSSHYQLSTNKLISRVHVQAVYLPAEPPKPSRVEVVCKGWNGVKVHCQGKAWELGKDDSFTSETQDTDIMIDVQDARVLLRWPKKGKMALASPSSESSPNSEVSHRRGTVLGHDGSENASPLRQHASRLQSPVSPSPAIQNTYATTSLHHSHDLLVAEPVQVYEDEPSDREGEGGGQPTQPTQSTQLASQPLHSKLGASQGIADLSSEYSDQDEENDPVIHSFGPFGENLLPRLASFSAGDHSPEHRRHLEPLKETSISPQRKAVPIPVRDAEESQIVHHVINQLAFSRLSSTPLSTMLSNLPAALKGVGLEAKGNQTLRLETLRKMLENTGCIGEVSREGKDAAGKRLESEFYYIPDLDLDEHRRDAVVDGLRKPGLRSCRKQHKVSGLSQKDRFFTNAVQAILLEKTKIDRG